MVQPKIHQSIYQLGLNFMGRSVGPCYMPNKKMISEAWIADYEIKKTWAGDVSASS